MLRKKIKHPFFGILVIAILVTGSISCATSDETFQSKGVITGQDFTMCACCGGWFITIDGENYRFDTLPADSGIILEKETMPLAVELDWQIKPGGCPANRIIIQRIKKI
jgi:hypothetical protein